MIGFRCAAIRVWWGVQMPQLMFASPRALPRADRLHGRVVVLDVAFAATIGSTVSFDLVTLPFITALGARLAA